MRKLVNFETQDTTILTIELKQTKLILYDILL